MHKRSVPEINRLIASGTSRAETVPPSAHHLHHYLHLAAALGANPEPLPPFIAVSDDEVAAIRQRFELPPDGARAFGLNAGAEYGPAKRWPAERFVAAAVAVGQRTNCVWWIFGGASDQTLAARIAEDIQESVPPGSVRNLAGKTSLRELCAALRACQVVLTNDTGPMHLAAAVGTPVVVPFGSTSPELTGPGRAGDPRHALLKSGVACAPCFLRECPIDFRCMKSIEVETVVTAVLRVADRSNV